MKNKPATEKKRINWKIVGPIIGGAIVAIIGGTFSLFNKSKKADKATPLQMVETQKVDSGPINNYNAQGNITIVQPENSKSESQIKSKPEVNSKPKKDQSIIAGDNSINIQGDNNTVNKYGLEINKPKINILKETNYDFRYLLPSPQTENKTDSFYKSTIDLEYEYKLEANHMYLRFLNASGVKYINYYNTGSGILTSSKDTRIATNGDLLVRIMQPINGPARIEAYSIIKYENLKARLLISIDSMLVYDRGL